jgi:hypothetical protein
VSLTYSLLTPPIFCRAVHRLGIPDGVNSDFYSTSVICIGFSVRDLDLNKLPGWEVGSVGYHGDDGGLWNSNTNMTTCAFASTFGTGDTVGCGITLDRKRIFFTKNGIIIGGLHHSRSGRCRFLM